MKKRASKRELIAPGGDKRYIRRDDKGRISQDRRNQARNKVVSGQGDRGDRKRASKAPARKKTRAKR
jgi:hypothetical protein